MTFTAFFRCCRARKASCVARTVSRPEGMSPGGANE